VALLLEHGADIEARTNENNTPFLLACQNGHLRTAQILAEKGADVIYVCQDGLSALHLAAMGGHAELVSWLLDKAGADIEARTNENNTPFHLACQNGHLRTAQILAEKGADVMAVGQHGMSAIQLAGRSRHKELVSWLVDCLRLRKRK
jgi:ankyrin repeat protein